MSTPPVRLALFAGTLLATPFAGAAALPFEHGDPKLGMAMVEKDCQACHIRNFGDADRIYLRPERRVRTPTQLSAQVSRCNTELGSGYFPDEEDHIAAYLNQRYYKFNP